MVRLIQSLGRLSVRGYLLIAGFFAIAVLASYSNIQSHLQIAAQQAKQQASERARTDELSLKGVDSATQSTTDQSQASSTAESTDTQAATQSQTNTQPNSRSTVQATTVINGGALVFSPAKLTLSLSGKLPLFTVSSPDGTAIGMPSLVRGSEDSIHLKATDNTAGAQTNWSMQLTGRPKTGVYHLPVHATTTRGADTVEYTGTLTVVVLL